MIVFLIWLWISNIAVLLGAELNAEIERGRELEAGVPGGRDARARAAERAEEISRRVGASGPGGAGLRRSAARPMIWASRR